MAIGKLMILALFLLIMVSGCISPKENGLIPQEVLKNHSESENQYQDIVNNSAAINKENTIKFSFFESDISQRLSGIVYLNNRNVGNSHDGTYELNESTFFKYGKNLLENEVCINGSYYGWRFFRCWIINLTDEYFGNIEDAFIFNTSINPNRPMYYSEMINFVRPDLVNDIVSHWKEIKIFTGYPERDLDVIWNDLNTFLRYRDDQMIFESDEYWKLPNDTYKSQSGDCEDWTNTFVSMAKSYNSSIKCFSVRLTTHLTAFCKIYDDNEAIYIFYDQNTKSPRTILGEKNIINDEKRNELKILLNSYFGLYEIEYRYRNISAVFDNKNYYVFKTNDEFVDWALKL